MKSRTVLDNARQIAAERDISLQQLAIDIGISPTSIYRWGRCEPKLYAVARAADRLYCTIDELIDGVDVEVDD